jgi:hypothetical protein
VFISCSGKGQLLNSKGKATLHLTMIRIDLLRSSNWGVSPKSVGE